MIVNYLENYARDINNSDNLSKTFTAPLSPKIINLNTLGVKLGNGYRFRN